MGVLSLNNIRVINNSAHNNILPVYYTHLNQTLLKCITKQVWRKTKRAQWLVPEVTYRIRPASDWKPARGEQILANDFVGVIYFMRQKNQSGFWDWEVWMPLPSDWVRWGEGRWPLGRGLWGLRVWRSTGGLGLMGENSDGSTESVETRWAINTVFFV